MTKTSRARYTLEFKQEAVRLVEGGQSIAAAARALGVVDQTLFNWVKAHKQGKLKGADSKAPVSAEQMKISRLRAELARVKMERDILGKATAYFARGHSCSTPSSIATSMPGPSRCNAGYCRSAWPATASTWCASSAPRRHLSEEALLVHIKAIHAETRGAYSWPRIWRALVARGVPVGKERVQKLMQLHGFAPEASGASR